MPLRPRPEIEKLDICAHGGPDYAELSRFGYKPDEVIDFSVSANPYGPPPAVQAALGSSVIDRYPDSTCTELRDAIADSLAVDPGEIIVGNGSTELIRLIGMVYLGKGDLALISEPTFGEYEIACQLSGAGIARYRVDETSGFRFSKDRLIDLIRNKRPKVVFICNPNNPTGGYLTREEIQAILSVREDGLLVLDEAYINFVDSPWNSIGFIDTGNIIILRSMTKDYALAGLRLGYAVASSDIVDTLKKACPPWNVNAVAQQAGLIAIGDKEYPAQCTERVHHSKRYLNDELINLGMNPVPSRTHFFLVKVEDATFFRRELLKRGIVVRDCASFGLPRYIRIATRTQPECERLINEIRNIVEMHEHTYLT